MKKLMVVGASGGTGKQVVEQALKAGYRVTALVRDPLAFALQHPNLKLVKGNVLQPQSFQNELNGMEAVVSCLGIPKVEKTTLYSESMKNITTAMKDTGVNRIVCISSGAIDIPPDSSFIMSFLLKNVLQRIYKPVYSDMVQMESILENSDLNWTIVRAPKLTNGKNTKTYRIITQKPLRNIPKISRADLADYMLNHLNDVTTYKTKVEIAY